MKGRFIGLMAALLPSTGSAYTVMQGESGNPLRWVMTDVPYEIQSDVGMAESTLVALRAASGVWGEIEGGEITLREREVRHHGVRIRFEESDWLDDNYALAITTITYDTLTDLLVQAEVAFNAVDYDWSTGEEGEAHAFDVQNIATHELGHAIGLGHSDVAEATMYPQAAAGEISKRDLHTDDEVGAAFLYPWDGGGRGPFPPYGCSVAAVSTPLPTRGVVWPIIVACALAACARAMHRRAALITEGRRNVVTTNGGQNVTTL